MQTLMSLRGKGTAKHREAQAKGKLKIKQAPLKYAHIMDTVEDLVGRMQSRTNTSAATFVQTDDEPTFLKEICCPNCMKEKKYQRHPNEDKDPFFEHVMRALLRSFKRKIVVTWMRGPMEKMCFA